MTDMTKQNFRSEAKGKRIIGLAVAGLMLSVSGGAMAQAPQKKAAAPAAVAPAAPAGKPAAPVDASVVARAGDYNLTRDAIRAFVATLPANEQAALARDPALFSQTLRVLLANQLVLKEAMAKKWENEAAVATQIQRARDNVVVETYLQAVSTPPAEFPSQAELEKAYEANKASLVVPRQFQVAQIFVSLPAGAGKEQTDKAAKKVADVQAKLKQPGADFAAIAKANSDEPDSAARGGEIGWLAETQLKPEIKAQVIGLQKGATSEPVKAAEGWHFLKLIDTKPASTLTFDQVRSALAQRLRAQQAEATRRAYLARLLEQSPPTINELALSQVLDQPKTD